MHCTALHCTPARCAALHSTPCHCTTHAVQPTSGLGWAVHLPYIQCKREGLDTAIAQQRLSMDSFSRQLHMVRRKSGNPSRLREPPRAFALREQIAQATLQVGRRGLRCSAVRAQPRHAQQCVVQCGTMI